MLTMKMAKTVLGKKDTDKLTARERAEAEGILLLDDFWSEVKKLGSDAVEKVRPWFEDNKGMLADMARGMLSTMLPGTSALAGPLSRAVFGGQLRS